MLDKNVLNKFNQYVKSFDMKNKDIMGKFHHTYRVVEYAKKIGESLNLNSDQMHTLLLCALLHDIGRFDQVTRYKTFKDLKSIDHGKLGYDILKSGLINDFTANIEKQEIILFSVLNHNKLNIPPSNEINIFFTKIVKDADKMDILKEQALKVTDKKPVLNYEILNFLSNEKPIKNDLVNNDIDKILRCLGFIFDINYKYTYKFILDEKIIENKLNLIEIYTEEDMTDLKEYLLKFVREKLKN